MLLGITYLFGADNPVEPWTESGLAHLDLQSLGVGIGDKMDLLADLADELQEIKDEGGGPESGGPPCI
jgi:hypothetical protein